MRCGHLTGAAMRATSRGMSEEPETTPDVAPETTPDAAVITDVPPDRLAVKTPGQVQ